MKTRIRSTKALTILVSLLALAAICAIWSEIRVKAVGPPDDGHIVTGLVHVTTGQSVQLNVSFVGPPDDSVGPPDDNRPVTVELMILDANGAMVAQSTEDLLRRRSASLMLNRDLLDRTEGRLGLRAVVMVSGLVLGDDQPISDSVVASFEVVDNASQRTMFVSPVELKGFNPQPEPPASR
jgi:hypothetical protein